MDIQFKSSLSDTSKLYIDRRRLQQVLLNLLTNAIKFQAAGKIIVTLSTLPDREDENRVIVHVSVKDQGIGMSPKEMESVFKLNWRSKEAISQNLNLHGNGLGLWICQKICKGLGGTIEVHSAVNIGSTFVFSTPGYKAHPETELLATPGSQDKPVHYHSTQPLAETQQLID